MQRFHVQRAIELVTIVLCLRTAESILLVFHLLERLSRELLRFTVPVESMSDFTLLGLRLSYLMISELIEGKSIAIMLVEHFRILFVGGEVIVSLPY